MSETQPSSEITQYPLLPLRDVVVFPHMVIPLFVGRPKSIKAMETAMEAGKSILLVAQRSAAKDDPGPQDMYAIGCVSNILQMLKLPDGTVKVLVEGTQRARIVNVTSVVGLAGNKGQANYAASKAGLVGLTKAVARELASRNVLVNAIAPGYIDTELTRGLAEQARQALLTAIPLGRLGHARDIADAVLFLASDLASYITGHVLVVDGGMVM